MRRFGPEKKEQIIFLTSCDNKSIGLVDTEWGDFGRQPGNVLEADSGEKLELRCVPGSEVASYSLFYTPPGG